MKLNDKVWSRCYVCKDECEAKKLYTAKAIITITYPVGSESEEKYVLVCSKCAGPKTV